MEKSDVFDLVKGATRLPRGVICVNLPDELTGKPTRTLILPNGHTAIVPFYTSMEDVMKCLENLDPI
jgi:hypothetical protein